MKRKIGIFLALVVIVGVAYWAFDSVRQRSYSGSNLSFKVGGGEVVITNLSDDPIPVEMRADGRSSFFRVESAELELKESSKRQGSGRTAYQLVSFELPPGQTRIDVTRGSGVHFVSPSPARIQAVVTPMEASGVRTTLGFAGIVILVALYYISRFTQHRWIGALGRKLPIRNLRLKRTAA